jgi:hypothetical protein
VLDGSGSDASDNQALSYVWTLTSQPSGSVATLSNSTGVKATIIPEVAGSYTVALVVTSGSLSSASVTMIFSVAKPSVAPVANAGANQSVTLGAGVALDGSGSSDANGDSLSYAWAVTSQPSGSGAVLVNANAARASITPDVGGIYVLTLVVNDGKLSSPSSSMTVTASPPNVAPVANAGMNQTVLVTSVVMLDGTGSSDANGDSLTYLWSLTSRPAGSVTTLSSTTVVKPTFSPDRSGTYGATLTVNDGKVNSVAAKVTVLVETPISGILSASEELTITRSPYSLTGTLSIPGGMALTMDSGIQIDGGGNAIVVEGTLSANGTVAVPVLLYAVNIQPAGKLDVTLQHLIDLTGVVMKQGSVYSPTGNAIYGSLKLRDSQFIDLSGYVYLWYPGSDNIIDRNIFIRSGGISYGVDFRVGQPEITASLSIQNNYFQSSTTGFDVENWTCYGVCTVVVAGNSFMTAASIALELPPGYTDAHMSAAGNYWGTVDASVVQGMIYNRSNDITSDDYIVFQPFLLAPDPMTPIPAAGL